MQNHLAISLLGIYIKMKITDPNPQLILILTPFAKYSSTHTNRLFTLQVIKEHLSCHITKPTKWHVHPAKTQISLGIRPVWSESLLSTWRKLGSLATHQAHSEASDQTGQMPRLIWVFAGCTVTSLVLSCRGSFCEDFVWSWLKCIFLFFCTTDFLEGRFYLSFEPAHDKTYKMTVRTAKTQISLGICPVWSQSLLCAQWVAKNSIFLHPDSKASHQTGRMPRLIWVFAGRTGHFVGFVMRRLIYLSQMKGYSARLDWNISNLSAVPK